MNDLVEKQKRERNTQRNETAWNRDLWTSDNFRCNFSIETTLQV